MTTDTEKILDQLKQSPQNVRFSDLLRLCRHYFGEPRNAGSSHYIFKTPWKGDPRINIQNDNGKAKAYQVRQVLSAIYRLKEEKNGCGEI